MTRRPFRSLPEARRVAELRARGLDANMVPLGASDAERLAARPVVPEVQPMPQPLVSGKLLAFAGVLAGVLSTAATLSPMVPFLPPWVDTLLWGLAAVAALLTGVALPEFKGRGFNLAGAPAFGAAAAALFTFGSTLPDGTWKSVVLLAATACTVLSGKAIPSPNP